mgnify:CR=1 FL=1
MFYAIYNRIIAKNKEAVTFIVLLFFVLSFIASRMTVYLSELGIIPEALLINSNVRGVHVHHFAYGFVFLTIAGFMALHFHGKKTIHRIAAFYGIGLGISYDEFGMWLKLQDNYWVRQSYDAIAIIFVFLVNIVYFKNLWQKIILKSFEIVMVLLNLRLLRTQRKMKKMLSQE